MAREILFKGLFVKSWDDDGEREWDIYGIGTKSRMMGGWHFIAEDFQYVGKKDKNGHMIFEGDLFKFKLNEADLHEEARPIELLGSFSFGSDLSFEIDVYNHDSYVCLHYIDNGKFYDFEIVGHLVTHPELINQQEKNETDNRD